MLSINIKITLIGLFSNIRIFYNLYNIYCYVYISIFLFVNECFFARSESVFSTRERGSSK